MEPTKTLMEDTKISQLARTLLSLDSLPGELELEAFDQDERDQMIQAKYFRPLQDERMSAWFIKFLSVRGSLWEIIDEVQTQLKSGFDQMSTYEEYQIFVIGFVSACQIVRLDRFLLEDFASHRFIQRKLNEGSPKKHIPRKQYTRIFESFVDVDNARRMRRVMKFAKKQTEKIMRLSTDSQVGVFASRLPEYLAYLDPSKRNFLKRSHYFLKHALRRRGATIKQHTQFKVFEASGRALSNMVNKRGKHVTKDVREAALTFLRPGDILITRHKYALTNLFLPGFWPHAAMYIGPDDERDKRGIQLSQEQRDKWTGNICTFEALKDGVLFRSLESTLAVDGFAVLRPSLSESAINQAIERIIEHEGKKYNFDFDFFRSDRLVCTELIYRAYDGLESMHIDLKERAGRPTLSAEDLCDLALDTDLFQVVSIFGVKGANDLITDQKTAIELLNSSYRN